MIKKTILIITLLVMSSRVVSAESLVNAEVSKDTKVDWMELKSGEWLRGEFKGLFSGKIEFDSKEFDLVKFDVDDVNQIITLGNSTINLNREMPNLRNLHKLRNVTTTDLFDTKSNELTGNLKFSDGKFQMKLSDGTTQDIASDSIASILGGEASESHYWSASVFVGLDILSGNTEQVTLTGKASAERRTSLTRFRADYLSTYTKIDTNITTADNNRFTSSFDLYQTNHFYWRLASLEYIRDHFKNLDGKYTLSVGAGYDILYTDTTDWSVTMGPGYQKTSFNTVSVGEKESVSTGLFFLDTRFSQEVTDDIDFLVNYNMSLVNEESGTYVHHAEVSLETELINDFTIDISLFWDRVDTPTQDDSGTFPDKNDFKTMLAIGYSY